MTGKLATTILVGLLLAGCSNQPAATSEESGAGPAATAETDAAIDVDDDTLEPAAPKVEEGEEHNEDAPHSH